MLRFWRYQIRYRIARALMHSGLWVWPPGRAKDEILELIRGWSHKVTASVIVESIELLDEAATARNSRQAGE